MESSHFTTKWDGPSDDTINPKPLVTRDKAQYRSIPAQTTFCSPLAPTFSDITIRVKHFMKEMETTCNQQFAYLRYEQCGVLLYPKVVNMLTLFQFISRLSINLMNSELNIMVYETTGGHKKYCSLFCKPAFGIHCFICLLVINNIDMIM
jgi:hypothetical protein